MVGKRYILYLASIFAFASFLRVSTLSAPPKPSLLMSFGLAYLLLGIIALASPITPFFLPDFALGIILLLVGVAGLVHVFIARQWDGLAVQLLVGVVASVTGYLLVREMLSEMPGMAQILEGYFLIVGLFRLLFALVHRRLLHRGALVISGLIGLVLGFLIPWVRPEAWMMSSFVALDSLVSAGRARWVEPGVDRPRPRPAPVPTKRTVAKKRKN